MTKNPILFLIVLLLLKNRGNTNFSLYNTIGSLQLESLLDNLHSTIHMLEKMNQLGQMDWASTLPEVKKMLEVVEKIPL